MEILRADFWHSITFQQVRPTDWKTDELLCRPLLKYAKLGVCRRIHSSHLQAGKYCPVTVTATPDITISAVSQICVLPALNTIVFFPASQCYRFPLPSAGLVGRLLFKALSFNIRPSLNPVPRQKEEEKRETEPASDKKALGLTATSSVHDSTSSLG